MALNFGCRLGWMDYVLYGLVVSSVLSPGVQGEFLMKTDATDDTLMDNPAVNTALTIAIDFCRRISLGSVHLARTCLWCQTWLSRIDVNAWQRVD